MLTASFLFAAVVAFHPEYAEHIGIARPGTLFATYAGAVLIMRRFVGEIADRVGPLRVAIPGMAVAAAGSGVLAMSNSPLVSYIAMAFTGLGAGVTFPALTADSVRRVPDSERGSAMGSFMAFGDVGQASAGPLVGIASAAFGFRWVYGIPALAVACGCLILISDVARRRMRPLDST
jgi:MFS family permease